MTNSGDQGGLSQRLVDWLEHERAAAVAILRERGEPEEVRVMATIATDIEERSVSFRQEELPGHPFDYIRVLSPLIEHPPAELADERTRLMDDLLAIHDPSVWWDPLSAGKEPREQVDRQVLSPLRARYLTSLETINPDLDLAQALVRETLDLIGRRRRRITTRIALGGLRLIEGEVSVAEVLLRPITEMELGGLGQRLPYPGELSLDEPRVSTVERVVMEVTAEFDSSVANPRDRTAERVLLALQLLGHTPHGGGYAVWRSVPIGVGRWDGLS